MHFDLAAIPQNDAYKLLVSTVVPYARTSDLFLMERIGLAEWKDGKR